MYPRNVNRLLVSVVITSAIAALYCLGGIIQAASLFSGERAQRNYELWGSLFLLFATTFYRLRCHSCPQNMETVASRSEWKQNLTALQVESWTVGVRSWNPTFCHTSRAYLWDRRSALTHCRL